MHSLTEQLDSSENFGDVFEIVKKSVKECLGRERAGLMLVLADLPLHLGAFHGVGTNSIVMNRTLLDRIVKAGHSRIQVNSFVYSILLHEYLHSLGVIEEPEVRSLVRDISIRTFGENHPAAKIATAGPWAILNWPNENQPPIEVNPPRAMELVRDFDRSHLSYIR